MREPNLDRFNDDAFRGSERHGNRYDYDREDREYESRRDRELKERCRDDDE